MAVDMALLAELPEEERNNVLNLFEQGVTIPPQPSVLVELQEALHREDSDVRELANIVSADPGIVASLFRVVKNTSYRRFQPFTSVLQIFQAIGSQQTFNLVRAISLMSALPSTKNRKAFESYWARSHAVADLAMLIAADRVSICNIFPDQACLAGVFHDCGVPVLMQRFPNYCKEMRLEERGCWSNLSEEDERFNVDHCVIGYLLAKYWKLPGFICDAIRFHHDISRLDDHESRTMVSILQLAMHIYHHEQGIVDPEWAANSCFVLDELGVSEAGLPEVIDDIIDHYHAGS